MVKIKNMIEKWVRPWWVELEMLGLLPEKIGRYRMADLLLTWSEK